MENTLTITMPAMVPGTAMLLSYLTEIKHHICSLAAFNLQQLI
nr:MAG TPA: hypothetical protein [Caudoviricetes sp.]